MMTAHHHPDPDHHLFDQVYASLRGSDPTAVPWAHGAAYPLLASWLETAAAPPADRRRALIVGTGLGDDAEAVAARGWDVTAFDASETAVDWARERFPDSPVDYHVADLFDPPVAWQQAFALVVEIHTIQALPPTRRQATIAAIADTVAPGGELVVIAMTRDVHVPFRGRPWPLSEQELASFAWYGITEHDRVVQPPERSGHPGRVRLTLTRTA